MGNWQAPFLQYPQVKQRAQQFLDTFHRSLTVPVPIDLIADRALGITIVPCHEMKNAFDVDGYLSADKKTIHVDMNTMENNLYRYRFTIAHELGHLVLHPSLYDAARFITTEDWKSFVSGIAPEQYGWAERQAYWFAGSVLLPASVFETRFRAYVTKAIASGYPLKEYFEDFIEFISAPLGREFAVSPDVVERQIIKENLRP